MAGQNWDLVLLFSRGFEPILIPKGSSLYQPCWMPVCMCVCVCLCRGGGKCVCEVLYKLYLFMFYVLFQVTGTYIYSQFCKHDIYISKNHHIMEILKNNHKAYGTNGVSICYFITDICIYIYIKDRNLLKMVAHFYTCLLVKKCMKFVVNTVLYLEKKTWRFLVEVSVGRTVLLGYCEGVEARLSETAQKVLTPVVDSCDS